MKLSQLTSSLIIIKTRQILQMQDLSGSITGRRTEEMLENFLSFIRSHDNYMVN